MERVTVSLDEELLTQFDSYLARKGYENRSEGIRDLLREKLEQDRLEEDKAGHSVASLSYVYNHHQRDLSMRLTEIQHGRHDLVVSTIHVHLDHDNCLEIAVLEGPTADIRSLSNSIIAETGVRHGKLHLVPSDMVITHPRQGEHGHAHKHHHAKS